MPPVAEPVSGAALLFAWPLKFCAFITVATYVLSVGTGNVSQVDRVWSILPAAYTFYFTFFSYLPELEPSYLTWVLPTRPVGAAGPAAEQLNSRPVLMATLVALWSIRLSYNTWRRGLYSVSEEDYRWAVLRKKIHWTLFQLLNLVFIAIIQNILLLLLGIPALRASLQAPTTLGASDYTLALIGLALLAWEFTADNQQWSFHAWKAGTYIAQEQWPGARLAWTDADRRRGFVTRGLWAWSRHPNFFAEQSFWCVITLFPILAHDGDSTAPAGSILDRIQMIVRLLPAVSLCLLFVASTRFTESITAAKYPGYAAYQSRVSIFVPWLTPVWGVWVGLWGAEEKARVDELLWGEGEDVKAKKKE